MNCKAGVFSLFILLVFSFAYGQGGGQLPPGKSALRIALDSGKRVYAAQCLACHQVDGLGVSNMNPPLTGQNISGDKKKLIITVIGGLATHQEIDGVSYQNVMPAHPEMMDQEIANVLTYIRNSFGNKASPVKASEVKAVRSQMKKPS